MRCQLGFGPFNERVSRSRRNHSVDGIHGLSELGVKKVELHIDTIEFGFFLFFALALGPGLVVVVHIKVGNWTEVHARGEIKGSVREQSSL